MPGLLDLPTEVLTLIVEEVCITAELDNLGQTVTVELQCPHGDAVDEGVQRLPSSNALGGAQIVRYSGSRPDIRQQRDQLEALLVQRFREQAIGRVGSGSFLHGVHGSHKLDGLDQSAQAEVNELILNHRPNVRYLLALASTCRGLRTCAEPFLYDLADVYYENPCAYPKHLGLMLLYPHLTRYVRLLSFSSVSDERFDNDQQGFMQLDPIRQSHAISRLLARGTPISSAEIFQKLGPESFGLDGLHPSMFRAMFLFLLPDVRSLKFNLGNLGLPEYASQTEKARRQWLFRALLQKPHDVWTADKVPALRNLEDFSLILRVHILEYGYMSEDDAFDPRLLLPFLFLPKMRILYTSSLRTAPSLILTEYEISQWSGESSVTEMVFDFAIVDGLSLDSILRLPRALEKLTVNYNSSLAPGRKVVLASAEGLVWHDADRPLGHAFSHQRQSLRNVTVRCPHARARSSIRRLDSFTALEELTAPLRMVLSHVDRSPRSLKECLPASIVRLELLVYDHFPVVAWQLEVLGMLNSKDVLIPKLRYVRVEHWMRQSDGPASKYGFEAEAVVSLGRQVGVEVQVDFLENKHLEVNLGAADVGGTE